jgi:two-component system sensor histidine kinase VicK
MATYAIAQGMLRARTRIDMCVDAAAPIVGIKLELLKEAKIKAKKKGVRIRYITEITNDNLPYCKELTQIVELRHLDNIQGNFGVSDGEYMAIATIEKEKPVTQVIYSNVQQIIRQHQSLFETLWSKAIPAKHKIMEIEEGRPIFGKTEILYGEENAVPKGIEFMKNVKKTMDIYFDYRGPSIIIELDAYRNGYVEIIRRGGKIRALTEITDQNIHYCKDLLKIVNELRHLDKLKGGLAVSEKEMIATTVLQEAKPLTEVIYSNAQGFVQQGQYIFDALWNKAVPAEQKIKEIEEGVIRYETRIIENPDEVIKEISRLTASSNKLDTCLTSGGIQYSHKYFFDIKKKLLDKQRRGEHKGIRYVTNIDNDNLHLCKKYLDYGIQIRHMKNLPPMSFGVSDKEIALTIEKMEGGERAQSLLISNEPMYVRHFTSLFEEIWSNGINARHRIKQVEEGIEPQFVEVITDGSKATQIILEFARSIKNEALLLLPHSKTMIRADKLGLWNYLVDAAENGAQVKIICPISDENARIVKRISDSSSNIKILNGQQTESGIFIADGTKYFSVEDRDVNAEEASEAISMMVYSNSRKGANLFKSFFDALWIEMDLYEKLKMHEKAQKEFINIAAHELRTPIQPILGLAEVLQDLIHKEPERVYVESILRNARRLKILTEQILDVTRIESRRDLILNKELFNLNESILTAIEDTKNYNDKLGLVKSIKFNYTPTDRTIMVFADKNRIYQVLSNLLANAVKFNKKNGEIFISAERLNNEVVVKVRDTGYGIDSDVLPKLFTKFITKSDRGTGLGLYISRYIIESHGGIIKGENNKDGKGATFTFILPLECDKT